MAKPEHLYGTPWSEREYVIALHYYLRHRAAPRHEMSGFVQELAKILGRTPASIVMRMENFANLDPEMNQLTKGLANVGRMCWKVFHDWHEHRDNLQSCAELLIRESTAAHNLSLFEPETVTLPKAFGKYELLDHLGDGGTGSVFSCVDIVAGKPYAIKIIKTDTRFDDEALHRFVREIRILRTISNTHIIRLHEDNLDDEKSFPAFVMDLAACSLARFLEKRKENDGLERPCSTPAEAALIFRSIASGVSALHNNDPKVIHRDINPNNILLSIDSDWMLADFGLAKFLGSAPTATTFVTKTHMGWGTAYYAAPEQYKDFKRTDERTDIYALGILLWDLFTTAWPPPESLAPGLTSGLAEVFVKATARDPGARYQNVKEMLTDFNSALIPMASVVESAGPNGPCHNPAQSVHNTKAEDSTSSLASVPRRASKNSPPVT
jgi:serine/threonine protein kinase